MLLEETKKYRVESENDALNLIETARQGQTEGDYELIKYDSKFKTKKSKGEIVDAWYLVTITKRFGEEH